MHVVHALKRLGYYLEADGANIRFRYLGGGQPPASAKPLLEELRARKTEALAALLGTASEPVPHRLYSTLPPDLSRELAGWPPERQELWRRRLARIQAETRWPLSKAERAAYWDVQRWWMFLDAQQRPRVLH
jgi:hypothetical protein